jgi:hypothetical protein
MRDRTRVALRLESRAVELGARKAELLHVSVPSRRPLLQPIAKSLRGTIATMQIRDRSSSMSPNVKARAIRSAVGIATDLGEHQLWRKNQAVSFFWKCRPVKL